MVATNQLNHNGYLTVHILSTDIQMLKFCNVFRWQITNKGQVCRL